MTSLPAFPEEAVAPVLGWGDENASSHAVQFYEEDGFLLDRVSRFIGSALGAGDPAITIATQPHLDGIESRLANRGLDMAALTRRGLYVALDAVATLNRFMVDGSPDSILFVRVVGDLVGNSIAAGDRPDAQVAIFGEMVAPLYEQGAGCAAIEVERLWNELAHRRRFRLRCAYPMRLFYREDDGIALEQVCGEHGRVIPTESYTPLTTEEERLRTIVLLQHKAQVLETEIQERTRLLMAEQEARALAERTVRLRDEFLSNASHELRTPITVLKGSAQFLARRRQRGDVELEPLDRMLAIMVQTSDRLSSLVDDLLDVSRSESGDPRS